MKRITLITCLICTPLLFILGFKYLKSDYFQRKQHESFLNELYSNNTNQQPDSIILKPTFPSGALLQEYIKTVDPELEYVPKKRLYNSYKNNKLKKSTQNTSITWENLPVNYGGRTRAIMWDPNDSVNNYKKVWAGGVTGGLWYNNDISHPDSGWHNINDFWDNLVVNCITHDPNNPETFYIGTGEPITAVITYRESSGIGIGIWKSEDAGQTWNLLPSTEDFAYISDMEIRIEDGNSVIYAGVVSGKYKGINHNSVPSDGLYRSTDSGSSWIQVLPYIPNQKYYFAVSDIEIASDNRIFVGTMRNLNSLGASYVLHSDDGINWESTSFRDYILDTENYNIPGKVILASAPSDADRIYALVVGGFKWVDFIYGRCYNIFRSDDGGTNWTKINTPSNSSTGSSWSYIAWHALTAVVHPSNPDILYAGSVELHRTINAGVNWSRIASTQGWYPNYDDDTTYVHADLHALKFKPNSTDELIIGCDGGMFYSNNISDPIPHFIEKNKDYNTLQFYSCDIHPYANEDHYIGGLQDNGTIVSKDFNPISKNTLIGSGDGCYCFIDKNEPNVQITMSQWNYYNFTQDGFETTTEFMEVYRETGIFINPVDYDSEKNIIYANGVTDRRSNYNTIVRITNMSDSPVAEIIDVNTNTLSPFSAVKISGYAPTEWNLIYLGTQSGKLFKIINSGSSILTYDITGNSFPTANISSIDIGRNSDHLLVTFSNYGVESVWLTNDLGETWTNVEGNLPDIPVRWGVFHPDNYNRVFLATELGVWSTANVTNNNVTWHQEVNGLGNVRVDMLRIRESDNTILAATHGRGLYIGEMAEVNSVSEMTASNKVTITPNPASEFFSVNSNKGKIKNIRIFDTSGKLITTIENYKQNELIDCSGFKNGVYIIQLRNKGSIQFSKFIKD